MDFRAEIEKGIKSAVKDLYNLNIDPVVEHPAQESYGDYASGVALTLAKSLKKAPLVIAAQLKDYLDTHSRLVTKAVPTGRQVEVAPPGFLNFWLAEEAFLAALKRSQQEGEKYGSSNLFGGKKVLLEHTSPNPQTTIMLGHLRNNFLGMAVSNLLESSGAKVTKDCIVNDRGVHICRSIWGYLVFARKDSSFKLSQLLNFKEITDEQILELAKGISWRVLLGKWAKERSSWLVPKDLGLKPDHANLIWYVLGSRAYGLSLAVKKQVEEILLAWEAEEKEVWGIWEQILRWSHDGYLETYKRVGSVHDWVWYESKLYKQGKELVEEGLKKGVFRRSEGAVVTDLAKYSLPDTVLIKTDGTAVYLTFDLNLTLQKKKKFSADLYIWDIGEEQSLYFKQLFALCEQLGIGKREDFFHLSYALVNFKGGRKMSTRKGMVVPADEALDILHARAVSLIKSSKSQREGSWNSGEVESLAEKIAVGAIKYSLLKFARETTIQFDLDESISLEGNSAPYLQYTYARAKSVLAKAQKTEFKIENLKLTRSEIAIPASRDKILDAETPLLRWLYRFPEVVEEAVKTYSPNLLCNYLFELAQRFNSFYDAAPILKSEGEVRDLRLALTAATAQVVKNGLTLLGIETPERL